MHIGMTHQEARNINVAGPWKDVAIDETINATLPERLVAIRLETPERLVGTDVLIIDTMIEAVVVMSVDRVVTPAETHEAQGTLDVTVMSHEDDHVRDPPAVTHENPHGNQVRYDCRALHQGLHEHRQTCPIGT
jgi:hypothetical protein